MGIWRTDSIVAEPWKIASATLFAFLAFCVTARAEVLVSRYTVSLDGFHVGDAVLQTDLDSKSYKVAVSADVGMLPFSTQIQGRASGARSGTKLTPEHYQIVLSGSEEGTVEVRFATSAEAAADGAVRLKGVFDPLSALLVASLRPSSDRLCETTLPIFTGRDRLDLRLRPKSPGPAHANATLVLCEATLSQPMVSGTSQGSSDWELVFRKAPNSHFWLVDHITMPTPKGIVTIDRAETAVPRS